MTNRASLGHVYDQLKQQGYIEGDDNIRSSEFESQNDSPWFIQGLMGCGGWMAAIFVLGVVAACMGTFLINIAGEGIGFLLLIFGIICTVVTVGISQANDHKGIFTTQMIFIFHLAGHLAIAGGLLFIFDFWETDGGTVVYLVLLILLEAVSIYLYSNGIYRFLGVLAIVWCINGIAYILGLPILVSISIGLAIITALLIWTDKLPEEWQIHKFELLQPIAYGSVFGAFTTLIYEVSNRYINYDGASETAIITTIIMLLCLLWLEIQILKDYDFRMNWLIAIMTILIAVATISTPGILAGIIVILLAFRRRNHILLGIAYLYLASFIGYYYYWLDATLLSKSIILMTTGILLIVARLFLRRITLVPSEKKGLSA